MQSLCYNVPVITSTSNDRIKLVRRLQSQRRAREEEGRFVVEGLRLIETAIGAGARPDFVLHTPAAAVDPRAAALLRKFQAQGVLLLAVNDAVMRACTDTEAPQGLLAVVPVPALPAASGGLTVVADGVRDPGNLGTLLRLAAGAGAAQVVLAPGTVDAYNPKVVRAAMGAHFTLPVRALDWDALAAELAGAPLWIADARGGGPPWRADLRGRLALVIGGEAEGASAAASARATGRLTIPLAPGVESLNAATAGAMILYEVIRQRSGE